MPTFMLAYLVNIFGFASDINMDDIDNMLCQLFQCSIQQKYDLY